MQTTKFCHFLKVMINKMTINCSLNNQNIRPTVTDFSRILNLSNYSKRFFTANLQEKRSVSMGV